MLEVLARFLVDRRRLVLVVTAVAVVLAGAIGAGAPDILTTGGFEGRDDESVRAAELLEERFGQAVPNFLLLVTVDQGTVDDPPARREGVRLTNDLLAEDGVEQVLSHWSLGSSSPLVAEDRSAAIVIAHVTGDDDEVNERLDVLVPRYTQDTEAVRVRVGGFDVVFREVGLTIQGDLARAESVAIPITLLLLIGVFGSVVAASLPVAIGIVAIFGALFVLRIAGSMTDVSIFALNMVTAMGLGLAIDYSLFIVSRFREEMHKGLETRDAVIVTVRTAGRTIVFSGITVAISLSALLVFPLPFLRSFAYAGVGVVAMAVIGAVVFLPAVLAALGPRVDTWSLWRRRPRQIGEGFWHRMAMLVMRRPVPIASVVVIFLLVLGFPFLHVELGLPDERVLPPGAETREVHDILRERFSGEEVQSVRVVVDGIGDPVGKGQEIHGYAGILSELPNVARVDSLTGGYIDGELVVQQTPLSARFAATDAVWFQVVPSVEPFSKEAEELVGDIRSIGAFDGEVLVGGPPAQLVDVKSSLIGALPVALAWIAVATFVLLFLMFGSLLVPLKALVLNLLSLTAMFGAMVWVFQDGNLSGLLGFTATGTLDITAPILMFCVAFGLSMDYEVFLLSRIKETYDATGSNERAIAIGLERTGRIITAAALLISVVFLATATSSVRFIKLFGIGLALAVLMDAFIVRATLVPAFMRLAGRANWWLPGFLRPLHERVGIAESPTLEPRIPEPRPKAAKPKPKAKPKTKTKAAKPKAKPKKKTKASATARSKSTRGARQRPR